MTTDSVIFKAPSPAVTVGSHSRLFADTCQVVMRLFLVFDPDPDSRAILAAYLRHLGHQVLDTDRAEDALGLAREHRPDGVVTEFVTPTSPTYSFLETLRLDPATARIPTVVWTSRMGPELSRRVEVAGGVLVSKPTSPRTVYRALLQALERSTPGLVPPDPASSRSTLPANGSGG